MARRTNPTVIGAFVVGGLALATGAVFAFSGVDLFAKEVSYVAYFESSVKGLDVGAPIRFQGVRVGRVGDVIAVYDSESKDLMIPVTLTFEQGSVRLEQELRGEPVSEDEESALGTINLMINRGLKAELAMDSFVTGKLYVALTYYPDQTARYVNEGVVPLPEMPTTQSDIDKLVKSIEHLPVEDLFNETQETIEAVHALIADPRLAEIMTKISAGLDEVPPLARSAREALDEVKKLAATLNSEVGPTVDDLRTLMATLEGSITAITASAESAIAEAQEALEPLDRIMGRNYELPYRVQQLLTEMSAASRAIRSLVDYLERHPEAVIRGKR